MYDDGGPTINRNKVGLFIPGSQDEEGYTFDCIDSIKSNIAEEFDYFVPCETVRGSAAGIKEAGNSG